MTLSEELTWRGFVNQTTLKDLNALDNQPITFYWGVDPSAPSMTIGNLAAAMMVRHFINTGHKAILLVGGATGLIGDPDGKATEREVKSAEEIAKNKANIVKQYQQIFNGLPFEIVDNYDWFKDVKYLDFLREVGKAMPMTQLLDREFVKARIGGSGISYAEFSYSLIQGYDFWHLFKEKQVSLQVCGADQWGNSLTGVELIRRLSGSEAHVFSAPLIVNKTTGVKFGKTEAGAVWLDQALTSVFQFYQFWLNLDDAGSLDYLKIYTLLSKDQIKDLAKQAADDPSKRVVQKTLAYEVTKLVHGQNRADQAQKVTQSLFGGDLSQLLKDEISMLTTEIPTAKPGDLVGILVSAGLAGSNSEAQRLIGSGAISLNGQKISAAQSISAPALIKKGKNSFVLVI